MPLNPTPSSAPKPASRHVLIAALLLFSCAGARASCYQELKRALPDGGVVVFGEYHGTQEAPRFFGECVREFAARGERPAVFLEMSTSERARLAGFMASRIDEKALLEGAHWGSEDGRSSQAMLALLRALREDTAAGRVRSVTPFDMPYDTPDSVSDSMRDKIMASNLLAAIPAKGYSLVFTGNTHARLQQGMPWNTAFTPFAMQVRDKVSKLVSLDLRYLAGSAWSCTPKCGPDSMDDALDGVTRRDTPAVALGVDDPAYSGTFFVGKLSASPPARLAQVR
ncbi:hypothetical protein SAMN05428948_4089 [Massilia sp. CF038]|nr:hypothetical protein SAMN05428948_4089 [Massilia sp. CF038]